MPNFGVVIAILSGDRILLTQREDFEVWCLPGGGIEDGETLTQAAIREAREETSLEVRIERLVGVYSRPKWFNGGQHEILFAATSPGGALTPDSHEVKSAAWFRIDDLPQPILPWMVREARDAMTGMSSTVWRFEFDWSLPSGLNKNDMYRLRDESGLTRQEFFLQYARHATFSEFSEVTSGPDGVK
jgi:ADP-ribose pyrophosphatase YjhB (NUDIX family)